MRVGRRGRERVKKERVMRANKGGRGEEGG